MARRKNILDQGELAILEKETKSYVESFKETKSYVESFREAIELFV